MIHLVSGFLSNWLTSLTYLLASLLRRKRSGKWFSPEKPSSSSLVRMYRYSTLYSCPGSFTSICEIIEYKMGEKSIEKPGSGVMKNFWDWYTCTAAEINKIFCVKNCVQLSKRPEWGLTQSNGSDTIYASSCKQSVVVLAFRGSPLLYSGLIGLPLYTLTHQKS